MKVTNWLVLTGLFAACAEDELELSESTEPLVTVTVQDSFTGTGTLPRP